MNFLSNNSRCKIAFLCSLIFVVIISSMLLVWKVKHENRSRMIFATMRKECHPIVCELIDNRIVPGAAYKYVLDFGDPAETIKHGRFTILDFNRTDSEGIDMTNVRLIFIDNKAVKAFAESCTWEYVFFNIMTEDEKIEFENIFGVV